MALFENDILALVVLAVVAAGLYLISKVLNFIMRRTEKISVANKIKILFIYRIASFILIIFLIMEGFPVFGQIDPEYTAILTGSISTAIAFASSGVFTNLVAGLALLLMRPFEIGDLIKVDGQMGVVRNIKLTKMVMETFDNVKIVMANSDIISNNITNYTLDLDKTKEFVKLKDKIHYAENLFPSMISEVEEEDENLVKNMITTIFKRRSQTKVHNFIFNMEVEYEQLLIKLDRIESLCKNYKEIFKFKPRYHVRNVGRDLSLKFRILSPSTKALFEHQPEFVNKLYKIIRGHSITQ